MKNITLTEENIAKVARDMIVADRRVASQYDAFAAHYGLTADTASADVTEAARAVVLLAYPDTDPARLAGKNKADDQRWKDARAVRIGLVNAIKRATEDAEPEPKPSVLRVSLSGEGGGSTVVPTDHPMYEAIVMLLAADN